MKMKKNHHYSGDNSHKFWARINALNGLTHDELYSMGVGLQNLEERLLHMLSDAEKRQPKNKTKSRVTKPRV